MSPKATVRLHAVPDAPRRALGLVRVSKARDDMVSPELQRTAIEDHAARRGYRLVQWMEGLDESASRDRSPWWRRLEEAVALVEAREVEVVLVWKVSRAARHRRRWAVALDRIEVAGGTLESATEGLDATTSTGRLARGMLAELAAWEADVKSEQWKEAQARRRRIGLPHTGGPRFGYLYDKTTGYRPDPHTAPILDDLYCRYVAGEGFQSLAVSLNRVGVPTMRGGRWGVQTLVRQLDSGFAAGLLFVHDPACGCGRPAKCGRRLRLPGAHEPVITRDTWAAYLVQRDRMRILAPRERRPIYPLTGLVRHGGDCGASLVTWSKPDRRGVVQRGYLYRCSAWVSGACPGIWVKRETVEQLVLERVAASVADVDATAATKTARAAARASVKVDRARLVREQLRLEKALARLVVQRAKDDGMPESAYVAAREELLSEQRAIEQQLSQLAAEEHDLGTPVLQLRGLLRDWETLAPADRRDLLARFVARVEVSRDDACGLVVDVLPVGGR